MFDKKHTAVWRVVAVFIKNDIRSEARGPMKFRLHIMNVISSVSCHILLALNILAMSNMCEY